MKRKNLKKLLCALLIGCVALGTAACGGGGGTGGNGGGGGKYEEEMGKFSIKYDEENQRITWNIDELDGVLESIKIRINAKDYDLTGQNYFDVGKLELKRGEYSCYVEVVYNGERIERNIGVPYGSKEGFGAGTHVHFHDYDGSHVKTLFFDTEEYYLLEEDLVPLPVGEEGVAYTYNYNVGDLIGFGEIVRIIGDYAQYPINYVTGNGVLGENSPEYYTIQGVVLSNAKLDGYLFAGWYDNPAYEGNAIRYLGLDGRTGEITLYAKWIEINEEIQALFDAFENTSKAQSITFTQGNREQALDLTDGYYRHEKYNGAATEVVTNGYLYQCESKIYYPTSENKTAGDFYGLQRMPEYFTSVEYLGDGDYRVTADELTKGEGEINITVKDGKIVKFASWVGSAESVTISYTCEKVDINHSDYREERRMNVTVLYDGEIRDTFTFNVEGVDEDREIPVYDEFIHIIKENEAIQLGYFLDRECTKPVKTFKEVTDQVYYGCASVEYLTMQQEFTLSLTCECSTCNGKTLNYEMNCEELIGYLKNPYAIKDKHLSWIFRHGNQEYGKDYVVSSIFSKRSYYYYNPNWEEGKYDFDASRIIEFLQSMIESTRKKPERFTFEIYNYRDTSIKTAKANVVVNGKTHTVYAPISDYKSTEEEKDNFVHVLRRWVIPYVPTGYYLTELYDNSSYTKVHSGKELVGTELANKEFTVYAKTVADTRKTVQIHFGFKGGFAFRDELLMQHQTEYENLTDVVSMKVFATQNAYDALSFSEVWDDIRLEDNGYSERHFVSVAGYYLDDKFTKPVTRDMDFTAISDVYVKLGEEVRYTLHFINGVTLTNRAMAGTPLINLHSDVSGYRTYEYLSVAKFYSDAKRENEIVGVTAGDIYVGYAPLPVITLVCPAGCTQKEHTVSAYYDNLEYYIHNHFVRQGNREYYVTFYYDKECTKIVNKDERIDKDITLYGKVDGMEQEYRVHCGCLVHGATGFTVKGYDGTVINDYIEQNCNFGKYVSYHHYYADSARTKQANIYSGDTTEIWLEERTPVYVYADFDGLREDNKVLVENVLDVMRFNDDSEYGSSGSVGYALYTDSTYETPWFIDENYAVTAGQRFYFKKVSGDYTVTIMAEVEEGEPLQSYTYYNSVQKIVYAHTLSSNCFYGKKIVNYYYDKELTKLAFKGGQNVYINDSVTLYAEVVAMPSIEVYVYNEYTLGFEHSRTLDMFDYDASYWRYAEELYNDSEAPYTDGYLWELCKNSDGTGAVDLAQTAVAGKYYFVKNPATRNNYKFTVNDCDYAKDGTIYRQVFVDDGYGYYMHLRIGKGNTFYLPKTAATGAEVLAALKTGSFYYENEIGQKFGMGMNAEGMKPSVELFSVYTNSAKTTKLLPTTKLTSNTTLYLDFQEDKLERVTLYLDNGKTVFFDYCPDDMYLGGCGEIIMYLNNPSTDLHLAFQYPKFFEYGAFESVYVDSAMTERYNRYDTIPSKLYCKLTTLYKYTVYYNGEVLSRSASANAYTFSSYLKRLQDNVAFIPGYEPYISSTADGKNEVSGKTVMNGEYYVCYKRNSQAEITIVCKCDNSFMHDNEFRYWNADYTNSRLLGTYGKFYLDVGSTELKKMLNYMNENTHGLWVEGTEGAEHNIPKVKYYSDSACTKEITDFSVNGDMTIYVKIVG